MDQTVLSSVGFINNTMTSDYLMLNMPSTPRTDWGMHGPTTKVYGVRAGHGEGPRSSFTGAVPRGSNSLELKLHLSSTVPEDPSLRASTISG
jgi:hypothetical protein